MTPVHGFLILDGATVIETYGDEAEVSGDGSVAYSKIFDRLMAEAVTGDEAGRLIAAASEDLRSHHG